MLNRSALIAIVFTLSLFACTQQDAKQRPGEKPFIPALHIDPGHRTSHVIIGHPVVSGEGEGDAAAGEGEGDVAAGEGEGDVAAGEGEGDVAVSEGEGDVAAGEGEGEGDVASNVWRPFDDASPWNTPIPADAPVAADSAALIDDFANSSPFGVHLDINIARFSVPLFFVDSSTPTIQMTADIGGQGWGAGGFNATVSMPLPPGAQPDPESDHHISVVDKALGTEWGCWATSVSGGSGHAGLCAMTDLNGSGVRPLAAVANPWSDAHGARACGFPLVAGLIRPEEIQAGHIRHALVVAYPHIRSGFYTPPASTAQARTGSNSVSDRGIPCGGRMQLDPSVNVDAMNVSPAGKVILRALQEYGAYVGDYSGALDLYAQGDPAAQAEWSGVLDSATLNSFDMSQLRVIELGQLFDNGNG